MFANGQAKVDRGVKAVNLEARTVVEKPAPSCESIPESVAAFLAKTARRIYLSERSGVNIEKAAAWVAAKGLGDPIAPGLYVAYTGQIPQFHLFAVPARSTLSNPQQTQANLFKVLKENVLVGGVTPSQTALRSVMLILQRLPDISRESLGALKALKEEAIQIDLKNPKVPDWKRSITLRVGQESFEVSFGLMESSKLNKLAVSVLPNDIPLDQRSNKYCFELLIRASKPQLTDSLRQLVHLGKVTTALACVTAPVAAMARITTQILPTKILPTFTSAAGLQSAAESLLHFLPLAVTAVGTFFTMQAIQRRRFS